VKDSFVLPGSLDRTEAIGKLMRHLYSLPTDRKWRVVVEPYAKRSNDQNALLWALYADVLERGGETLAGWTKDDLHEWALGECFGWQEMSGLGKRRLKPLRRSSALSAAEFAEFVEWFVRRMAEFGIVLELPGEQAA
jgi:hypothetical protein